MPVCFKRKHLTMKLNTNRNQWNSEFYEVQLNMNVCTMKQQVRKIDLDMIQIEWIIHANEKGEILEVYISILLKCNYIFDFPYQQNKSKRCFLIIISVSVTH